MKRRPVLATAVAALVVGGIAVGVLDRSAPVAPDQEHDPQIREVLLEAVQPNTGCPDAAESPTPGHDQVVVNVVRVADGCLAYGSEVVAADDVEERLRERRAEPDVVAADEAVERRPAGGASPGRPRRTDRRQDEAPDQWALEPEHLNGERVRSLWPADAPEVRVAIIDTGIDREHLDLADQVVERAPWAELYDGEDDDHGTHLAGIVAAADDGAGVVGLTPAARLMDVQYHNGDDSEDGYAGPSTDIGEYVRWAVDHGADVINMSIQGAEPSDTELTAILYAELRGVVVVGISGNCGGEHAGNNERWRKIVWLPSYDGNACERRHETKWPAGYPTVLSVANHTRDEERYDHSSANATVDIAAPGTGIWSSCLTEGSDPRPVCEHTGTSQAAPFVSATAALLRARHPDATPAAIREAITRSAQRLEGQPTDRRTDELGWGLLDPVAAAEYLDEHPGQPQPPESPAARRTQVAFIDDADDRLLVFDDGILHPVRPAGADTSTRSVDWSADRSQLVGTDADSVFLWTGPGSTVVEADCDHCEAAFVERPSGGELIAAIGNDHTIIRFDVDTLDPIDTVPLRLPAPDDAFTLYGDAHGRLVVAQIPAAESRDPDAVWLVDPVSGAAQASHAEDGNVVVDDVAVDADGNQVAYVGGQPGGPCGHTDEVYILDGDDLTERANPDAPTSSLGDLQIDNLFFNGEALYATMIATEAGGGGDYCTHVGSAGLWRLDDGGDTWQQIDPRPVRAVRPVEGMSETPGTGRITITDDARGTFEPTGAPAAEAVNLGTTGSELWATPTRTEVDLTDTTSPPPISTPGPEGEPPGGEPAPNTTDGAIVRFEQHLQALGDGDVDTLCEIAGPAFGIGEDQGFGSCEEAYGLVVDTITPEEADALRTATVDPHLVDATTPGEVYIPVEAVISGNPSVTFSEADLGSYRLAYQDGNWYIVE